MISAAARVTVSARLSGSALVAISRVKTSCTTTPYLFRPLVFWLKSTIEPLGCRLPQTPGLGCQDLPGHVAAQGRSRPCTRQVPPVRELPPGYLKELAGIPHVEVPGQLLEQPDGLLLRHF